MLVEKSVHALLKGQVLAVPTDTLYGLVTLAEHSDKLYRIKRRSTQKPLGLFLDTSASIKKYCVQTVPDEFLDDICPGPVTLVFARTDNVPSDFNPGIETIGVRVPHSKFVRDLCRRLPFRLLAQTSANVSGGRNPLCIQDFEEIWDEIDLIIDAGPILENNGADEGSTVVDLSVPGQYKMIREGCAPLDTMHLLSEFGIRPADEVHRERLVKAGKGLEMLQIVAHEITKEERQRTDGEAEESVEGEERDTGGKDGKREEIVEEEKDKDTDRRQQRTDYA